MEKSPYQTNTKTVAEYRGVHERTIQRLCKNGKIPAKFEHGWKILSSWWESERARDLASAGLRPTKKSD